MYTAILFWISGILFTYGFFQKMFEDSNSTTQTKLWFALSVHLLFAWPYLLGDGIRRSLDKEKL
jgi:hypothetical protein